MKITKLDLSRLRNEEHFMLMTDVHELLDAAPEAVTAALTAARLEAFAALVRREDAALEQIRKNMLTDDIANADLVRDNLFQAIRLKVQAYAYSNVDTHVKASAAVQAVIDHYGDFRRKSYNEESAIIHNFVQDLKARQQHLTTMNLNNWVNDLVMVNDIVKRLMAERYDEQAAVQVENVMEVRIEIDALYRQMVAVLDASVVIQGEAAFAPFINRLNERVTYYKNTIAARKGRAVAKEEAKPEAPTNEQ